MKQPMKQFRFKTKNFNSKRFLVIYSGVLTAVFAIVIFGGFKSSPQKLHLKELTVQRINVVAPNGLPRMIISNQALFPGLIIKGKNYPHPNRKTAGILFYNNEGTENGGLTFGGYKGKNGKPVSYGHLSFDKYMQDQTLVFDAGQNGKHYAKGLSVVDQPDWPITEAIQLLKKLPAMSPEQRRAAKQKFAVDHAESIRRLYIGENVNHAVGLELKDEDGHNRIILRVKPNGKPVLEFLNADGKVISRFPKEKN